MGMNYNLALVFDTDVHKKILEFSRDFQNSNDCEFEYTQESVPHATLIKFASPEKPFPTQGGSYFVTLSGLTLLPSRKDEDAGTWVEISLLISQELRSRVGELVGQLDSSAIKSEVRDLLRPHITICKLRSQNGINVHSLDPLLFRMNNVEARLAVGMSKSTGFAFIGFNV